jgi:hypothetical protein
MRVLARSTVPLLLVLACDSASEDEAADAAGPVARDCAIETRADDYTLGMQRSGERLSVAILDATPAPPSRGDNTWRVRVQDDAGLPQTATIDVSTFMPDHQHGSSIVAQVEPADVPGEFVITPVDFFMPGLWEVTLDLQQEDGFEDAVVFRFCVDP